jgi:predicted outer membrane protein
MDRRTLMIAATGLSLPLLATRFAEAQTSAGGMSKNTGDYVANTLQIGALSKKISEMAVEKAKNPRVKEFAGFEIAEQTAIARVLTNQPDPKPPAMTKDETATVNKLNDATGAAFAHDYIRAEIEGHEKLLSVQTDFLKTADASSDHAHVAMLAETVIKMHLAMLNDLEKVLAG